MLNGQRNNYYRGDQNRIAMVQNFPSDASPGTQGQRYWYHYDALGSVVGLTKQGGQSDHNYRYSDFGLIEPQNGNFTKPHNSFTYTGQEWDEESNLYEFYSRAYDPYTSSWLQQDIYRGETNDPMSLHRYMYVNQSAINYLDLYGFAFYDGAVDWVKNAGGDVADFAEDTAKAGTAVAFDFVGGVAGLEMYGMYQFDKHILGDKYNIRTNEEWEGNISAWFGAMEEIDTQLGVQKTEQEHWVCKLFYGYCTNTQWAAGMYTPPNRTTAIYNIMNECLELTGLAELAYGAERLATNGISRIGSKGVAQNSDDVAKTLVNSVDDLKFTSKINRQLSPRGWTAEAVESTVKSPYTTRVATNKTTGNAATAFYTQDGAYVVIDDITKEIVQISEKGNANWIPDNTIQDPYKP